MRPLRFMGLALLFGLSTPQNTGFPGVTRSSDIFTSTSTSSLLASESQSSGEGQTVGSADWGFNATNSKSRIYRAGEDGVLITAPLTFAHLASIKLCDEEGVTVDELRVNTILDATAQVSSGGLSPFNETFTVLAEDIDNDLLTVTPNLDKLDLSAEATELFYFEVSADDGQAIDASPAFAVVARGGEDDLSDKAREAITVDKPATEVLPIEDATPLSGSGDSDGDSDSVDPNSSDKDGTTSGSSGGGLSTGAIAGIAVGAFVIVVIIIVGVWLFLRKRKRAAASSHHAEASTPLATTYPNGPATRSGDFLGEKEAGAVAESPRSQMYTDQEPRPSHMAGAAGNGTAAAATGMGGAAVAYHSTADDNEHNSYHTRSPVARDEPDRSTMESPVQATVARHLVEEDMTEDDIRRLEEEERELDRQIEEAGRRK